MANLKLFCFMRSLFSLLSYLFSYPGLRLLFFSFFFLHVFLQFMFLVAGFFSCLGELPFVVLTGGGVSPVLSDEAFNTWLSPMAEISDGGICAVAGPAVDAGVCSASDGGICAVAGPAVDAGVCSASDGGICAVAGPAADVPFVVHPSTDRDVTAEVIRIFESAGSGISAIVVKFPSPEMAGELPSYGLLFPTPTELLKGASPEVADFIESVMLRDYSFPRGSGKVNIVLYDNGLVGCGIWDLLLVHPPVLEAFHGALTDVHGSFEIGKSVVYHESLRQAGNKEFLEFCHSTLVMQIEHINQLEAQQLRGRLGDCLLLDPKVSPYMKSFNGCRAQLEGALVQIEALQAAVSSAGPVPAGVDVDLPEEFMFMGLVSSGTGPGDLGGDVEIIKYRDLGSYMATHPQGPGGTKVFIEMYNKTLLLADPAIWHALELMETSDGHFDGRDPGTIRRMRLMLEAEKRDGGFVVDARKTFEERTWSDWYEEHASFFGLVALALGCYLGYRWYGPETTKPWDSSDLH